MNVNQMARGVTMRKQRNIAKIVLGQMLAILALSPMPVLSQSTGTELEEITVTAQRREQSLTDVPYNISVLSASEIDAKGIADFASLTRNVAGLNYADRGPHSTVSSRLVMRGINVDSSASTEFMLLTVSPVSVYLDETPMYVNFHLFDIQQVEVLRGPQGTLYGSGSVGGSIRYVQNKPDAEKFDGKLSAGVSSTAKASDTNYNIKGMINMPLSETTALRASAGYVSYAGFIDMPYAYTLDANRQVTLSDPNDPTSAPATHPIKDHNDEETTFFRASLLSSPSDNLSFQLTYMFQNDSADGRPAQAINPLVFPDLRAAPSVGPLGEYEIGVQIPDTFDADSQLASLTVSAGFDSFDFVSSTSYFDKDYHSVVDYTQWPILFDSNFDPVTFAYVYPNKGLCNTCWYEGIIDNVESGFVQEFRFVSKGDNALDWIVGAFYFDQDRKSKDLEIFHGGNAYDPGSYPGDFAFDYQIGWKGFRDIAVFGELSYHLSDRAQVTVGARYFDQEFEPIFVQLTAFGGPVESSKTTDDGVLFKLNGSIDINDQMTAYATWSQGFRRGGGNAIPSIPPFGETQQVIDETSIYDSDEVDNYEIGIKGDLSDSIFLSAAVFYIDWDDIQISTFTPNFFYDAVINGESATSQGLELELRGSLTDNLSFFAGYTYTDAELSEDISGGVVTATKGTRLPGVAENMVTLALDYDQPLSTGNSIIYHIDAASTSDVTNDIDPFGGAYREFDGYETINASLGYFTESWSAVLYGTNLTDELGLAAQRGSIHATSQFEWMRRPRTLGLRFNYDFE
jgi:outer membrane receptor protein involved in Fe transport